MVRSARGLALAGALLALTVAGCTSGSDDSGPTGVASSDSLAAPSSAGVPSSAPATTGGTAVPSATNAPTTPASTGGGSGPAIPATPAVPTGDAGAYTLVVSGGGTVTTPVAQVTCQQDGSLQAGGLQLAAGGTSLRFTDVAPVGTLDVPGSAELTAAGGTFRGATSTTAVAFTWTC